MAIPCLAGTLTAVEYNSKFHQTIPTVQTGLPPASGHTRAVTTANSIHLELRDILTIQQKINPERN